MTDNNYKNYYEKEGELKDTWGLAKNSPTYYQEMVRYERILQAVGKSGTVVDFGCGDGYLSGLMASNGLNVISVDLALSRLKKSKAAAKHQNFFLSNIEFAAIKTGSVDIVVCSEVLEHIPKYENVVKEIYRVLKPGCRAIITVPYKENLKTFVCPHCHKSFHPDGHLHRFDRSNLSETFSMSGFKIRYQKTFRHKLLVQLQYHLKLPYGFFLRILDRLFIF